MNANVFSQKPNARLKRIKIVSRIVRILVGLAVVSVVAVISICLSDIIGWTHISPNVLSSPFSKYSSLRAIPVSILILGFVRAGLFFAGAFLLNKLLRFFANGNFFTTENITCIKWLGCLVMSDWLVAKFLDTIASRGLVIGLHDFAKLTIGFLIILIAWIMDEGRKIQEEQELTV
jgi:Protein of unknown function (DUF2975)